MCEGLLNGLFKSNFLYNFLYISYIISNICIFEYTLYIWKLLREQILKVLIPRGKRNCNCGDDVN